MLGSGVGWQRGSPGMHQDWSRPFELGSTLP